MLDNRMYVRIYPEREACGKDDSECDGDEEFEPPYTLVGAIGAFKNGFSWELGQTPVRVDRDAFVDNGVLWGGGEAGGIQKVDYAADPIHLTVIETYATLNGYAMILVGPATALLLNGSPVTSVVHIDDEVSILSRVFSVTVEARDAAGNISRATRHVHVVPYDHAPEIAAVSIVGGAAASGDWIFQVSVTAPDVAATWDPNRMIRADWNGDGSWDSDWNFAWTDAQLATRFPGPGTYPVRFEARDGFWARSATYEMLVVVP